MKKILAILFLSALLLTSCTGGDVKGKDNRANTAEATHKGIFLDIPKNWEEDTSTEGISYYYSTDSFSDYIVCNSVDFDGTDVKNSIDLLTYFKESIISQIKDVDILYESEERLMGDHVGSNIVYTYASTLIDGSSSDIVCDISMLYLDGKGYIVSCMSTPKTYPAVSETFTDMVKTFRLK